MRALSDTTISLDAELGMYRLTWGVYTCFFDSLRYSRGSVTKTYGPFYGDDERGMGEVRNHLVGKTAAFWCTKLTFIDLDSWGIRTFFAGRYRFFRFMLKEKEHFLFLYEDFHGAVSYACDLHDSNFRIEPSQDGFDLTSALFWTVLHRFRLDPKRDVPTLPPALTPGERVSIMDFFLFDDILGRLDRASFRDFLESLQGKDVSGCGYGHAIRMASAEFASLRLTKISYEIPAWAPLPGPDSPFSRLLLSEFPNYTWLLAIKDGSLSILKKELLDFDRLDFTNIAIERLEAGDDILSFRESDTSSVRNLNAILYLLYALEENIGRTRELCDTSDQGSPYIALLKRRNALNLESLSSMQEKYMAYLKRLLELIGSRG